MYHKTAPIGGDWAWTYTTSSPRCSIYSVWKELLYIQRFKMSKLAAFQEKRVSRRVPKPLLEKKRRDRINQSLETLRLLLLENTHNEKLKNPKVEKAEILESVVQFLQAEQKGSPQTYQITRGKRDRTEDYNDDEDLRSPHKRQSFRNGMRTCLLRVSRFIASKSQEADQDPERACRKVESQPVQKIHKESEACLFDASSVSLPHLTHIQLRNSCMPLGCAKIAQKTGLSVPTLSLSSKQPVTACDSVWRPWPQ